MTKEQFITDFVFYVEFGILPALVIFLAVGVIVGLGFAIRYAILNLPHNRKKRFEQYKADAMRPGEPYD